ncbi:hypothetical protein [Lentzea flaviverrucosa]|uniref:hypothetical protein n=1 Tax=Lentzea flaviverrucosa TaxID=200379 RepID=UPI000B7D3245|nr:hypothetical protein [Lentzea flaviverrucosa]
MAELTAVLAKAGNSGRAADLGCDGDSARAAGRGFTRHRQAIYPIKPQQISALRTQQSVSHRKFDYAAT